MKTTNDKKMKPRVTTEMAHFFLGWFLLLFLSFSIVSAASPDGDVVDLSEKVVISPNPLNLAEGETEMKFLNVPEGTLIQIYTPAGQLIKELSQSRWDGTNVQGRVVPLGFYAALIDGKTYKVGVVK